MTRIDPHSSTGVTPAGAVTSSDRSRTQPVPNGSAPLRLPADVPDSACGPADDPNSAPHPDVADAPAATLPAQQSSTSPAQQDGTQPAQQDGTPPAQQDATPPAQQDEPAMRVRVDLRDIQRATIRILLIVSAWLIGVSVLGSARHFLFLILLAWLVAIAAEPAIRWFVSRGTSRGAATGIVGGTSLVILVGLFVLFGTTAFQQASQLISQGPTVIQRVTTQLNETLGLTIDPVAVSSSLQLEAADVQKFADDLGGGVIGVFGSLASVLFDLITVIVFSFYIAGAGPGLVQRLAVWMPHERQLVLGELWQIATEKTGGYVASKVVLSAISSFFYGAFFSIVGLPGWLPLALLVGITAQFIPLVGTYIGIAVPIIVALADEPITALWILLFSIVYQQIETYLFTPHVSQRTMDVNPAVALAAVFLGAAIWGPIGAIIGVPIAAVIVALVDVYGPDHPLAPEIRATGDHGIPSASGAAARRRRRFSHAPFVHPVRRREK